jgi:hypothetical protein
MVDNLKNVVQEYQDFILRKTESGDARQIVEQAFEADDERERLAKENSERRRNITVRYFPRNVNREKVEAAIRELGFNLIINPSRDFETNAIWYGSEVCKHIEDVQLVAYTLMRAGVQLKVIETLERKGKENEIQVGGKKEANSSRPMTVDDIKKLKSCNE